VSNPRNQVCMIRPSVSVDKSSRCVIYSRLSVCNPKKLLSLCDYTISLCIVY
jgi:hypothetical protein